MHWEMWPKFYFAIISGLVTQNILIEQIREVSSWWFPLQQTMRKLIEGADFNWIKGEVQLRQTTLTEDEKVGVEGRPFCGFPIKESLNPHWRLIGFACLVSPFLGSSQQLRHAIGSQTHRWCPWGRWKTATWWLFYSQLHPSFLRCSKATVVIRDLWYPSLQIYSLISRAST